MEEIWKDIEGYEGRYQVSNLGRVKSLSRFVSSHTGKFKTKEKILSQGKTSTGYYMVCLYDKNVARKYFKVHRLVANAFLNKEKERNVVNHKDGNPINNNVTNLEWVTQKENIKHAYQIGLIKKQEINSDILKNMYIDKGMNISEISKKLNVSRDIVRSRLKENGMYKEGKSGTKKMYNLNYEFVKEQLKVKTSRELAKQIGCSEATISKYKNMKK